MENLGIVVLVPCPFQGHITPMLEVGSALHCKGFSIVVAHTMFNSLNPQDNPNFMFLPIPDNLSGPNTSIGYLMGLIKTINKNCELPLRKSLAEMMEQHEPHDQTKKIRCIIYDSLMYYSEAVADHLKLPSIILKTTGAFAVQAARAIPRLLADGHIPVPDAMLQDLVPGLHPITFNDMSMSNVAPMDAILEMIDITNNTRTSSAIIWNTFNELEHSSLSEFQKQTKLPNFAIGPLHKVAPPLSTSLLKEDTDCIQWLDKQVPRSVIYVSLGSLASMSEKELVEMAWGLANIDQPFLWVVRTDSISDSKWAEIMPQEFNEVIDKRGHLVQWAPQKEVLAHCAVGGFWSHCGWNSTLESISEGVPMICWPCFTDQNLNARYLSEVWRVGLLLDHDLEREGIERAIRRLMVDEEGEELRQRALDLKETVDICMKNGGSSYNSLNDLVEFILSS